MLSRAEAERCNMYYVNERWLGGYADQLQELSRAESSRLKRSRAAMSQDGTFDVLPKKEAIQLKKEWEKLEKKTLAESKT